MRTSTNRKYKKELVELKNSKTEMKTTLEDIKTRLEDVEEWISDLEDRAIECTKLKSKKNN